MKKLNFLAIILFNFKKVASSFWLHVCSLSSAYFLIYIFKSIFRFLLLLICFDIIISIVVFLTEYFFSIFQYSLTYVFMYFLVCVFNISFLGYYQFKFFGVTLNNKRNYLNNFSYLLALIKEYNYFFLVLIHIFLLNIVIFATYNNVILLVYLLLFYIFVILSIKVKLKWDKFDLNYKTKVWNYGFNIVLILVIGCYINVIMEFLIPSFIFKINGFEHFWNAFQNKWIFNLNFERSNLRWFNIFGLKKNYFAHMFLFNFKKNLNDQYILYNYNYNLIQKDDLLTFLKNKDNTMWSYINFNSDKMLFLQENVKKDSSINIKYINSSKNNFNHNDNLLNNDFDMKKLNSFELYNYYNYYNIFNYKNFLSNKLNFIIQNFVESKDIYPLEENNFILKNLLKKDALNYDYLLLDDNNKNLKNFEDYLENSKLQMKFYNNVYDLLLLKKDWKVFSLIHFNDLLGLQKSFKMSININTHFKTPIVSLLDYNKLYFLNFKQIVHLKTKIDLFILNWENKQMQIKTSLIKEFFIPNNFNIKNVLKELVIGFKNNPLNLLVNYSLDKAKISSYINIDEFVDLAELSFDKILNNLLQNDLLFNVDYDIDGFSNVQRNRNNNNLGESIYSTTFSNFLMNNVSDYLNKNYIIIDGKIYEIDINKSNVELISNKEYLRRMELIKAYEKNSFSSELISKQTIFDKLQIAYKQFVQNINKYYPEDNYKNRLLKGTLKYYENQLALFRQKDRFLFLNDMEKLIYFFNCISPSLSKEDFSNIVSFYNIEKYSMTYLRYNSLKSYYTFLYNYEDVNYYPLYKNIMFNSWNNKIWFFVNKEINYVKNYIIELKDKHEKYIELVDKIYDNLEVHEQTDTNAKKNYLDSLTLEDLDLKFTYDLWDLDTLFLTYDKDKFIKPDLWLYSVKLSLFLNAKEELLHTNKELRSLVLEFFEFKKELADIESDLTDIKVGLEMNYYEIARLDYHNCNDIIDEINKYQNFMLQYNKYEELYTTDFVFNRSYEDYLNKIESDKEFLGELKKITKNAQDWKNYFLAIHDYNSTICVLQERSQYLQMEISYLDDLEVVLEKIAINRLKQLDVIYNAYEQYENEIDLFLEDLKIYKDAVDASKHFEVYDKNTALLDSYSKDLDDCCDVLQEKKQKMALTLKNSQDEFFSNIKKRFPNVKFKNVDDFEKSVKNKDWKQYRLNRLNDEHWNKHFKDFNKIYNKNNTKKPYGFGK